VERLGWGHKKIFVGSISNKENMFQFYFLDSHSLLSGPLHDQNTLMGFCIIEYETTQFRIIGSDIMLNRLCVVSMSCSIKVTQFYR
jgi:hypothetical protein